MEVHKHPHHVMHKKNWPEYLLEFLMLFLAVFLGFLAENRREHLVDLKKERDYMLSLVQDLRHDTGEIDSQLNLGLRVSKKLDSLIDLLNEGNAEQNAFKLYCLGGSSNRIVNAEFENRTSVQLKSSGNFRLVRNEILSDSIRNYFATVSEVESMSARLELLQMQAAEIRDRLFYNKYSTKKNPDAPFNYKPVISGDAKLITTNPDLIAEYSNRCNNRLSVLYNYLYSIRRTKQSAEGLIEFINREYHFK